MSQFPHPRYRAASPCTPEFKVLLADMLASQAPSRLEKGAPGQPANAASPLAIRLAAIIDRLDAQSGCTSFHPATARLLLTGKQG